MIKIHKKIIDKTLNRRSPLVRATDQEVEHLSTEWFSNGNVLLRAWGEGNYNLANSIKDTKNGLDKGHFFNTYIPRSLKFPPSCLHKCGSYGTKIIKSLRFLLASTPIIELVRRTSVMDAVRDGNATPYFLSISEPNNIRPHKYLATPEEYFIKSRELANERVEYILIGDPQIRDFDVMDNWSQVVEEALRDGEGLVYPNAKVIKINGLYAPYRMAITGGGIAQTSGEEYRGFYAKSIIDIIEELP